MNEGDVNELIGVHDFGMARPERMQFTAQDILDSAAQDGEGYDNDE